MTRKGRWAVLLIALAGATFADGNVARSQSAAAPAGAADVRQVAYVKASNPDAGDHFGCGGSLPGHIGNSISISADGNYMAIGAHLESSAAPGINGNQNDNSLYGSGAVYVYVRSGTSWTQQAYVKASNAGMGDNFGLNVDLNRDGTVMAVAAYFESSAQTGINPPQDDDSIPQAGAVYIFERTGTTWAQRAYLKASNAGRAPVVADPNDWGDGDQFGSSLALSGDGNTLAVGAMSEDSSAAGINNTAFEGDDSANSSGAVYVFSRAGASWKQEAYIKASNSQGGDLFGYGVGLSDDGNTLAVAGYDEDGSGRTVNAIPDNLAAGSGASYVYVRDGGVWRQQAYLKGSRTQRVDATGISIAISGDGNTIASASAEESCLIPGIDPPACDIDSYPPQLGSSSSGAVYVWVRNGNTWREQAFIKATNPDVEDIFGYRIALNGDGSRLLVTAPNEDSNAQGINGGQMDNSATEAGAAYLFARSGDRWTQRAYLKGSNTEAFDEFGGGVAISGDGKTFVVGSRWEGSAARGVNGNQKDNSAQGAGAAYVFIDN
jgi:FG-GAP repeat